MNMQFRELVKIINDVNVEVNWFGIEQDAAKTLQRFEQLVQARYSPGDFNSSGFLDSPVPQELMDAFKPVYDWYVVSLRKVGLETTILLG